MIGRTSASTRIALLVVATLGGIFLGPADRLVADDYELGFSTYLGGSDWEHARDCFVDDQGYVYIVGGTQSEDFPTTEGAFQRQQDMTGDRIGSGGYCDAFVCKFAPNGRLVWSTLLGGPNYDRAYAVEVDKTGHVYVSGRGGPGFPVTDDAIQTEFRGSDAGVYGMQNGFLVKLKPDGSGLVWSTYVGVGLLNRDLAIDDQGDVYVALHYTGKGPLPPASWFEGALQPEPAGDAEIGAMKLSTDGKAIEWATWFGGSAKEGAESGIRLDNDKNVYLNFTTWSPDVPTTEGAHDRSHNGESDAFIAKLSPDGKKLLFGTYFGTSGIDYGNGTHNMALDKEGNAFLVTTTDSAEMPVTEGALQRQLSKGKRDIVASKFSSRDGRLLNCTYLGGTGNEEPDGVCISPGGDLYFAGSTSSPDFPLTDNALKRTRSEQNDAIFVVMAPDLGSLKFSTYLGGESHDYGRAGFMDAEGNLYLTGSINGSGWPTKNPHQPKFAGGGGGKELCYEGGCYAGDVILTKLAVVKPDQP
ncbi:Beta-propeller repeat protein [Planctomycetes bacterium Pan216]|uniref:Beta-propeller repeat protein n=1 Tax=Kolteria novifilia TaxID=2527975 RepID=A0A518B5F9_9BACT|nr:Beta-propeller repeat protein [Planctomycetes bacterium Pan216]